MKAARSGRFTIKEISLQSNGCTYTTHRVSGWLNGRRIRKDFQDRLAALGEKNALEVEAANTGGEVRARNTRLSAAQLAEAESAFVRLGSRPLTLAVSWFLDTYRPPVTEMSLGAAQAAFLAERAMHVGMVALRDYRRTLKAFLAAFPCRSVHSITTTDVQAFLTNRGVGPKRLNNLRGDLNAFFVWSKSPPREWTRENPVGPIRKFRVLRRGVPEVSTWAQAAELMSFLETYTGLPNSRHSPGFLVPYFALCLFAGLRPSIPEGEVCKLARLGNVDRYVDTRLKVIRIEPAVSKTGYVRQVTIQPNLMAWLDRYPLKDFPIYPKNVKRLATAVRKKFNLSHDVLRHTFISMHVAKFKSLGAAALEAGNSEAMIRNHYLNLVSEADAEAFWAIRPAM